MILANEQVAEYLAERKIPTLYRVHERPDPRSVEALVNKLDALDVPTPPIVDSVSVTTKRSQAFADSTSPGTCCAVTWVEFIVQPCRFYCRSRKLRLCHPVLVLHACRARRRVVYNDLK